MAAKTGPRVIVITAVVGSYADARRARPLLSTYAAETMGLPLVLAETRAPSEEECKMFEDLD